MSERERLIEAFVEAAHCGRWEFQDTAATEFVDALDAYILLHLKAERDRDYYEKHGDDHRKARK